jgi:hypothetical protein
MHSLCIFLWCTQIFIEAFQCFPCAYWIFCNLTWIHLYLWNIWTSWHIIWRHHLTPDWAPYDQHPIILMTIAHGCLLHIIPFPCGASPSYGKLIVFWTNRLRRDFHILWTFLFLVLSFLSILLMFCYLKRPPFSYLLSCSNFFVVSLLSFMWYLGINAL